MGDYSAADENCSPLEPQDVKNQSAETRTTKKRRSTGCPFLFFFFYPFFFALGTGQGLRARRSWRVFLGLAGNTDSSIGSFQCSSPAPRNPFFTSKNDAIYLICVALEQPSTRLDSNRAGGYRTLNNGITNWAPCPVAYRHGDDRLVIPETKRPDDRLQPRDFALL